MEFDLARLLRMARRWGIVVLLVAVLGGVAGYGLSLTRPVEYASTTTLLLQPYVAGEPIYGYDVNQGLQGQTELYQYQLGTTPFLQQVAADLGLDPATGPGELRAATTTVVSQAVPRIDITVTGLDPVRTSEWANAIATRFISYIPAVDQDSIDASTTWVSTSISEPAPAEGTRVSPSRPLWTLLGALLGGLLAASVVLAIEHLRASAPARKGVAALPVLAVVEGIRRRGSGGRVLVDADGSGEAARGVAQLRGAVQILTATQGIRTLAVSSLRPGEGKSTIATNLAVALAQGGDRVILVDANLAAPGLGQAFGSGTGTGLTSLMADPAMDLADAVTSTEWPNLMVIPAGPRMDDAKLDRAAFRRVLQAVTPHADLVIFEAPALTGGEGDRLRLAGVADGTLLVVGGERTRIEALRAIGNEKVAAGTNVVGVVIDRGAGSVIAAADAATGPGGLTLVTTGQPAGRPAATPVAAASSPATPVPSAVPPVSAPAAAASAGAVVAGTAPYTAGGGMPGPSNGNGTGNGNGAHANGNGNGSGDTAGATPAGLVRTVRAVPMADPDAPVRTGS